MLIIAGGVTALWLTWAWLRGYWIGRAAAFLVSAALAAVLQAAMLKDGALDVPVAAVILTIAGTVGYVVSGLPARLRRRRDVLFYG